MPKDKPTIAVIGSSSNLHTVLRDNLSGMNGHLIIVDDLESATQPETEKIKEWYNKTIPLPTPPVMESIKKSGHVPQRIEPKPGRNEREERKKIQARRKLNKVRRQQNRGHK